jgi:uncharacterized membrane protein YuzA (DUF378 family)
MCGNNCKDGACKEGGCKHHHGCTTSLIIKILVIVGGINWGLVGLGMLLGNSGWNVVNMALGSMPKLEAIVYVIVGIAAVMKIFGCKCKKCCGAGGCAGGSCGEGEKMAEKTM